VFVFSVMDFRAAAVSFSVCVFRYGLLSSNSFLQCLCFPLWTSEQQQFPPVFVFSVMDFWAATFSSSVCVFRYGLLSSSSFLQCLCFPHIIHVLLLLSFNLKFPHATKHWLLPAFPWYDFSSWISDAYAVLCVWFSTFPLLRLSNQFWLGYTMFISGY
jgi:hypothetical protein